MHQRMLELIDFQMWQAEWVFPPAESSGLVYWWGWWIRVSAPNERSGTAGSSETPPDRSRSRRSCGAEETDASVGTKETPQKCRWSRQTTWTQTNKLQLRASAATWRTNSCKLHLKGQFRSEVEFVVPVLNNWTIWIQTVLRSKRKLPVDFCRFKTSMI